MFDDNSGNIFEKDTTGEDMLRKIREEPEDGVIKLSIGKDIYSFKALGGIKGMQIFFYLVRTFSPTLASLADSYRKKDQVFPEDDNTITQAIILLMERMDEKEFTDLIMTLLPDLKFNGQEISSTEAFDKHFSQKYPDMFQLAIKSLKGNFSEAFTSRLKEEGLEIPTLSQVMEIFNKASTPEKSEEE